MSSRKKSPRTPQGKKPKNMTAAAVRAESRRRLQELLMAFRHAAAQDYITDPERRSVQFWHAHAEREYQRHVSLTKFESWSVADRWKARREQFWLEFEERVLRNYQDRLVRQRVNEINARTEERDALAEYLKPQRERNGQIKRYPETQIVEKRNAEGDTFFEEQPHPWAGLPVLSLKVSSFPQMIKAFIEFDKHLLHLRGEVTDRTEQVLRQGAPKAPNQVHLHAAEAAFSPEEIQSMAHALLKQRQPDLALPQTPVIEVSDENG